ncbi:MAG: hypothetical protein WAW59_01235 [Patescibacteria group bacterium]
MKIENGRRRGTNCPKILPLKIENKRKFSSGDKKGKYGEQSEYLSEFLFSSELLLLLVTKVKQKTGFLHTQE